MYVLYSIIVISGIPLLRWIGFTIIIIILFYYTRTECVTAECNVLFNISISSETINRAPNSHINISVPRPCAGISFSFENTDFCTPEYYIFVIWYRLVKCTVIWLCSTTEILRKSICTYALHTERLGVDAFYRNDHFIILPITWAE